MHCPIRYSTLQGCLHNHRRSLHATFIIPFTIFKKQHPLSVVFRAGSNLRSRPFNVQAFFDSQLSEAKMTEPEKKERISAEIFKHSPESPIMPVLPTVNPAVEKAEPPPAKLHPAFYVV